MNRLTSVTCIATLAAVLGCGSVPAAPDANRGKDAAVDAPTTHDALRPDAPVDAALAKSFTVAGAWACGSVPDGACNEIYDFDFITGSATAALTLVTGDSEPELSMFAGSATTGTDVFTGSAALVCPPSGQVQQDVNLTAGPAAVTAGHFRIIVGRDFEFSAGTAGTFTLTVTADGLSDGSQTGSDLTGSADCGN